VKVTREERKAVCAAIRNGLPVPPTAATQLQARAAAVAAYREFHRLTGTALRASLERERELLDAAMTRLDVGSVVGATIIERDASPSSGAATVLEFPAAPSSVSAGRTIVGYFSRYNQPTLIDDHREGRFVETIAPGAFTNSIEERAGLVKACFSMAGTRRSR
jgi:hypothetical protein